MDSPRPAAQAATRLRLTATQATALRSFNAARELLAQQQQHDLVQLLDERAQLTHAAPTVVLVGEAKRGKSSLVNALLGRPGLSPVGSDITTGRSVRFLPVPGQETVRDHLVVRFSDGLEQSTEPSDLAFWACGPSPADASGRHVESVDVTVAGSRFRGAAIIDTPGAGGLDGGHTRLALLAARRAGIVVLVTDAGQPLTQPEWDFLRQAAETVAGVAVVVTKIDKYPAGAAEVIRENRALLRAHAPQIADAPIIGVSSEWSRLADDAPDELAEVLRERSGVPELTAWLESRLGRMADLVVGNAVRTASSALRQRVGDLADQLAAAREQPGVADRARAERDQLTTARDQESRWSMDLERDLRRVRSQVLDSLCDEADRLRLEWRARIERQRLGFRPAVSEQLTTDLQADLAELLQGVADRLEQGMEKVAAALLGREAGPMLRAIENDRPYRGPSRAPSGVKDVLEPGTISAGAIGAGMGAGINTFFVIVTPLLWPIAAGAAFIALTTTYKQVQLARRRQLEWAFEEIVRARAQATAHVDVVINELKPEIAATFKGALTARIRELQAVVNEADAAMRKNDRDRTHGITVLESQVAATTARLDDLDRLLPLLSAPDGTNHRPR